MPDTAQKQLLLLGSVLKPGSSLICIVFLRSKEKIVLDISNILNISSRNYHISVTHLSPSPPWLLYSVFLTQTAPQTFTYVYSKAKSSVRLCCSCPFLKLLPSPCRASGFQFALASAEHLCDAHIKQTRRAH